MAGGEHVVTVGGVDLSCLVLSAAITHGREDTGGQPEASSATLDMIIRPDRLLPDEVEIGASVVITTTTVTTSSTRFEGRVTDLSLGWDDAGEDTPDAGVGQLVAVGLLADLGRRVVGDVPWPQELDGARVSRALSSADVTLDPAYSDPGTVQILPRDVDAQPALGVAADAATSASGVIWQTRAGEVRYADASHRRGTASTLTLDACDLLITPRWRRALDGLVNQVSIGYGVAPTGGGDQPRYYAEDDASMTRYGRYGYSVATSLAALDDATALGQMLLVRNSRPVWLMTALPVDVKGLDDARYDALLSLDMHALLTLTGLPAIGTAPTSAALWVEGWKETLTWNGHDIELTVSGYCRTVPAPHWNDVDPAWLWGGEQMAEQRRNNAANPSLELDEAGWTRWPGTAGVETHGRDPAAARLGGWGYRVTWTTAPSTGGGALQTVNLPGVAGPVTGSLYVRSSVALTMYAQVQFYAAGTPTTLNQGPYIPCPANVWTRLYVTGPAAATDTTIQLRGYVSGAGVLVDTIIDFDTMLVELGGTLGDYFDGDTADYDGAEFAWAGTPGASASTLTGRRELRRNKYSANPALRVGNGNNVTVRTNLATNPSAEAQPVVGWTSNNGAVYPTVDDTTVMHSGTRSRMSQPVGAAIGNVNGPIQSIYNVGGLPFPVTVGQPYTVSLWLLANCPANGDARIYWLDAANAAIGAAVIGATVPLANDGQWKRASVTATAPAGAVTLRVMSTVARFGGALVTAADRAWADDCLVENMSAPALPYFDGTTAYDAAEGITCSWSGTAHASTSLAVAGAAGIASWAVSGGVLYKTPDGRARFLAKVAGAAILYGTSAIPATLVDTWSAGARVVGAGGKVRMEVDTYNQAGANTKINPGAYVTCDAAGVRPVAEGVAGALLPADTTGVRPILRWDSAGGTYTVGEFVAELAASVGAYFDGSTPAPAGMVNAWAGAVDASESLQSEVVSIPGGMPSSMTWDDAACLGPPVNMGRWDDQPASLRWDQVAADAVWNNYTGGG